MSDSYQKRIRGMPEGTWFIDVDVRDDDWFLFERLPDDSMRVRARKATNTRIYGVNDEDSIANYDSWGDGSVLIQLSDHMIPAMLIAHNLVSRLNTWVRHEINIARSNPDVWEVVI